MIHHPYYHSPSHYYICAPPPHSSIAAPPLIIYRLHQYEYEHVDKEEEVYEMWQEDGTC